MKTDNGNKNKNEHKKKSLSREENGSIFLLNVNLNEDTILVTKGRVKDKEETGRLKSISTTLIWSEMNEGRNKNVTCHI